MHKNLNDLPDNLPVPTDDGKTNHLLGMKLPDLKLQSTLSTDIELKKEFKDPSVLFIYPRAGSPIEPNTNPDLWDSIPGARGCTPQSCGFRDLADDFTHLGYKIYGMSIQSAEVQKEFVERNHISFPILSDSKYAFTNYMNLPTFDFEGSRLIKRMALVIKDGEIKKVFYPVFPPDKNAQEVLEWLKANRID